MQPPRMSYSHIRGHGGYTFLAATPILYRIIQEIVRQACSDQDVPDNKHFETQAIILKFQGWNLEQEGGHVTQVT